MKEYRCIKGTEGGEVLTGVVAEFAPFGTIIKFEDGCGFIRVCDVSWDPEVVASDVLSLGDSVTVMVQQPAFMDQLQACSLKHLTRDPLEDFARLRITDVVSGRVTRRIPNLGVFVDVGKGILGLIRSCAPGVPEGALDELEMGDQVQVDVLSINLVRRKVFLRLVGVSEG